MKLRELKEKDIDGMLSWMHSEESKEIFEKDFNKYTREDVLNFIKTKNTKNNINFACVNEKDEYLGTVSLKNINYDKLDAEFAISFTKEAQGTGAASFATNEILKIAFNELKLEKVYLCVLESNKRAIAFYKKNNFKEEGVSKNHLKRGNKYIDLLWFSILKKEFNINEQ